MRTLLTSNLDTGLSYHRNIVRECTKGLCHLAEGRWAAMEYGHTSMVEEKLQYS